MGPRASMITACVRLDTAFRAPARSDTRLAPRGNGSHGGSPRRPAF
jgi:hypothetical protein